MRFYDASFLDFGGDYKGYGDALLSLTRARTPAHIKIGKSFFAKYAKTDGHKHQALCAECFQFLNGGSE
jgi:hypothetical protein